MALDSEEVVTLTGVTTGVEAAMVSFRAAVTLLAVLSESLTVTLKEEMPLAEGVPLMAPLVESANPEDLRCESHGLQIFADPDSAGRLTGTTIDFIQSLEGAGFSFNNPQAKSTCGCGKSFC